MTRHKVSGLDGPLLDAAVALADDHVEGPLWKMAVAVGSIEPYSPSTSWSQAGPIIDREKIGVYPGVDPCSGKPYTGEASLWFAVVGGSSAPRLTETGPTPLIAAMRAYVRSRFGDKVELP